MSKTYYWLKLKKDFFKNPRIKKLRGMAGGDTYTCIYLQLLLSSLETDGVLVYEGIEPTFAGELSLITDEDETDIQATLDYLIKQGLMEQVGDKFILTQTPELTGKAEDSKDRVKRFRKRQKQEQIEAKEEQYSDEKTECNEGVTVCNGICNVTCNDVTVLESELESELEKELEKELESESEVANATTQVCVCVREGKSHDEEKSHESKEPPNKSEEKSHEGLPSKGKLSEEEKSKRFKKPSLEELEAYKTQNNLALVDCEAFFDFYESKGWVVGKSPMKDWRATMRNWDRTEKERGGKCKKIPTNSPLTPVEEMLGGEMDDAYFQSVANEIISGDRRICI